MISAWLANLLAYKYYIWHCNAFCIIWMTKKWTNFETCPAIPGHSIMSFFKGITTNLSQLLPPCSSLSPFGRGLGFCRRSRCRTVRSCCRGFFPLNWKVVIDLISWFLSGPKLWPRVVSFSNRHKGTQTRLSNLENKKTVGECFLLLLLLDWQNKIISRIMSILKTLIDWKKFSF